MKILVTGGAGYIGSFMVRRLLDGGEDVVVADSLSRGHRSALDSRADFMIGNLLDRAFVQNLFQSHVIDAVIHFAGYISMGESVENPGMYFENNIFSTLNLLEQMRKSKVSHFVFSSTAGVYGNPVKIPIPEDHQKVPANPYGESKLTVEKMLRWYKRAYGIKFVALRYFNASGAALDGSLGEDHDPETHIIPLAIKTALKKNDAFFLYGTNYNTPDGTAVRDYIHVLDLVDAHVIALKKLQRDEISNYYNVGTGKGCSNKEVIEMIKKISGIDFSVKETQRRQGDAEILIADSSKIQKELLFHPKYSNLETIVESAWRWHRKHS